MDTVYYKAVLVVLALAALATSGHSGTSQSENDEVHNALDDSRSKFNAALHNLSEYLPLSVEYATTVGQECDIVKYNGRFYTEAGLIISAMMLVIGIIFGFFGYRLIKMVLFLIGFVTGSALTYFIILAFTHDLGETWVPYVAVSVAVVVGIICGVLAVCIYYIGIFLAGASAGFLITWFFLAVIDVRFFQTHIWFPFVASLIMAVIVGLIGLRIQKWFFMLGTAILGGFQITWAVDYVLELGAMIYYLFLFAEHRSSLKPCWYSWSIIPLFVILGLAGFIIQAMATGRKYDHKKEFEGICCGLCKKQRKSRKVDRGGKYMDLRNETDD